MTENHTEELRWGEIGTPTDLWRAHKALAFADPDAAVQAWRMTVRTLEGFCQAADALMLEPLQLALVDALGRAGEELERTLDHEERVEGVQLTEREEERLLGLLRRSDALLSACVAIEDWSGVKPEEKAAQLAILGPMRAEAHRDFMAYRHEVGIE